MLFYSFLATLDAEEQDCAIRIFEMHQNLIYNIAYQILRKPQDAEDTVDEVMINVITHIHRFQNVEQDSIVAQLTVYSRNAAINLYRKNRRRNEREMPYTYVNDEDEQEEIDYPDMENDVEEIILSRETSEIVKKYIREMPIHLQDTIELVYGFGYSNVEASRILHITPNAVGLRLYKVKKLLLKRAGGELNARI